MIASASTLHSYPEQRLMIARSVPIRTRSLIQNACQTRAFIERKRAM